MKEANMLLYPPVECNKGYLITVFQAGKMKYPEGFCFNVSQWPPLRFFKFCVNEFYELAHFKRPTACVPQCIHEDGVMRTYWECGQMSQGWIGFYECFRFLKEHYENVQNRPEDWWKDICPDDFHRPGEEPWGKAPQEEIEAWLDLYTHFTGEFRLRDGERKEGAFNDSREMVLTPPLRVGLKGQYLFRASPDVEPVLLTCSVAGVRTIDYLRTWVCNLEYLCDNVNQGLVGISLVLDADDSGRPVKWCIALLEENRWVSFSSPIEGEFGDYTWDRETGFFDFSVELLNEYLDQAEFSTESYSIDDIERWIEAGRTLLNAADVTDEDECY